MSDPRAFYEGFYSRGGWKYDHTRERAFLKDRIVRAGNWKKGDHVLEVGAGMGHHSELLRQLGFRVTALELSESGASYARKHYPNIDMVRADASTWSPPEPVDHVLARGMSFFHYELLGKNSRGIDVPRATEKMFRWIRPEGTFVLQIVTDFSGRIPSKGKGVHMNKLGDYMALFSRFGQVISVQDWNGKDLSKGTRGRTKRGIVIATRKPQARDKATRGRTCETRGVWGIEP